MTTTRIEPEGPRWPAEPDPSERVRPKSLHHIPPRARENLCLGKPDGMDLHRKSRDLSRLPNRIEHQPRAWRRPPLARPLTRAGCMLLLAGPWRFASLGT